MTAGEFRTLALSIPQAIESTHMNHPDFRLRGKVFASLDAPDIGWAMVKLTPDQQRAFLEKAPDAFRPCNGVPGQRGYTNLHLASATIKIVRSAVELAAQNV